MWNRLFFLLISFLVFGCSSEDKKNPKQNLHGEYIYRFSTDCHFTPPPPLPCKKNYYPWDHFYAGKHPRITKDFFRCKGNPQNPVVTQEKDGKILNYYRDCCGGERHGLPLRNEKEFIYPCLLELLNYLQETTGKKVIVTSGHRCPLHNLYCDFSSSNASSKHMMGAEVDFYVEGLEQEPQTVVALLQRFYQEHYPEKKEYLTFERYQKNGLNVSTPPWYNKEIFIKLYTQTEGRNIDNSHPYPYIGIQVRYDKERNKPVTFDAKQAGHYLRH